MNNIFPILVSTFCFAAFNLLLAADFPSNEVRSAMFERATKLIETETQDEKAIQKIGIMLPCRGS